MAFDFGSLVAPVLGGLFGGLGQDAQNRFNAGQASNQMDFQRDMSNTAHQREVKDLEAAGLNPILSGTGGSGASTPGGAMATGGNIAESASNSAKAFQEIKASNANVELTKGQTDVASTTANVNRAQEDKIKKETKLLLPMSNLAGGANSALDSFKNWASGKVQDTLDQLDKTNANQDTIDEVTKQRAKHHFRSVIPQYDVPPRR